MSYVDEFLEAFAPDWETDGMGDEVLIAPDGCRVEQDGQCSHGFVSPLLRAGLI